MFEAKLQLLIYKNIFYFQMYKLYRLEHAVETEKKTSRNDDTLFRPPLAIIFFLLFSLFVAFSSYFI